MALDLERMAYEYCYGYLPESTASQETSEQVSPQSNDS